MGTLVLNNTPPAAGATEHNGRVARFYDLARGLYPLVDCFCAPGRRRLIAAVNREPPGRLLEIGVGPGRHLPVYRGHAITAVDCSAAMVASAARVASRRRVVARNRNAAPSVAMEAEVEMAVEVRQMDGEALEFPAESFDYVVLCHVLSVTTRPDRMLAEVHRVLRPGGRAFVLNHETPANALRHLDRALMPLAAWLRFRSWFRLAEVDGVGRFRVVRLAAAGGLGGLMRAHLLEK